MLWLAGLLGMMMVGSMAAFMPQDSADDADDETPNPAKDSAAASTDTSLLDASAKDFGGSETDLSTGPGANEVSAFVGGDAADVFLGTDDTDLMNGQDGDDTLIGRAGDDEIFGGGGTDSLSGGAGNDTLHGEAGSDLLVGDAGDDVLFGHDGNDTLEGAAGEDELHGGLGDDALDGGASDDALHGREGSDRLRGGAGQDTLFGGDGADVLDGTGDAELDFLNANDGDDRLIVGANDIATGGAGQDEFILDTLDPDAAPSTLMDFDAAEDQLVILFDDTSGQVPEITLADSAETPGMVEVQLDGQTITTLPAGSAPPVEAIALIGQSAA